MTFEKKNHHYVPQFWQRGFSDSNGRLFGRMGTNTKQVSSRKTMSGDWLYTVFDGQWNPSDSLENALSILEGSAATLFRRIGMPSAVSTTEDRDELCSALALQACRHPDIMARGHRLGKDLGTVLARAHAVSLADFTAEIAKFGVVAAEAQQTYEMLIARPSEQLALELEDLNGLSPQDPQLPEQEALLARPTICAQLHKMEITLLDAPPGSDFVLGDTPLPQEDLSHGFSLAISRSVAVSFLPSTLPQTSMARRVATKAEVDAINKAQWENAFAVVVGPNKAVLAAL